MTEVTVERFAEPASLVRGLSRLRQGGLTPRGLLFLALAPDGAIHVGTPADPEQVTQIKVGEKLALVWPSAGRFFHYDAIHRLPGNFTLYNGDRRLKDPGDALEVAQVVAGFLKGSNAKNVLFGCTSHQPGSWLAVGRQVMPLHELGFVEVVPVPQGLLARRQVDPDLYFLPANRLVAGGRLGASADDWTAVYRSPLGNVLLLERRVLGERLVLSCEGGLVEVDVSAVPNVEETLRVSTNGTMAVVGRIDGGAFAVTSGQKEEWGLAELRPALLIGGAGDSLIELGRALRARGG
jgi:hypothetical protein